MQFEEPCRIPQQGLLQMQMNYPHACGLVHRFSNCSVRSPRAPREKPRGSASCSFTYAFIFRNLLWGSV